MIALDTKSASPIELLAPAGNMTCLHAAVCAGANAVYLGLDRFNARQNASNFTLDMLKEACDYAHLRNVRVYVTMNVEILPSELTAAIDYAHQAYEAGADALILQDIGLVSELRRRLPQLEIHLSTQMNIHNAAGIELAAVLGAQRVTLARELSLEEIAELAGIAHDLGIEIECFAHGALCICYSGQCLMSSLIGGRSANRGLCAQACRLPYELHVEGRESALPAEGDHLLSPKDLCTIDLLDHLQATGVASLKIEGRMKSADYVYEVVSTYREVLNNGVDSNEAQRTRLAEAFSRGFTTAYLEHERSNKMMSYGRPNNRGVLVGRVSDASDNVAFVRTDLDLNNGDLVEFWTNRGHFTAQVDKTARKGETVPIEINEPAKKGDRVFRVRNSKTAYVDVPFEPRIAITGSIELSRGKPATITFSTQDVNVTQEGEIVEAARTKEITADDVYEHIDRLGQTPFVLVDFEIQLEQGVGIGFSALHHLRTKALAHLEVAMLEHYRAKQNKKTHPTLNLEDFLSALEHDNAPQKSEPFIAAWATNPSCARAARKAGAQRIYVPILNFRRGYAQIAGIHVDDAEQAGYPKECIMALPTIDHDPIAEAREATLDFDIWDYVKSGKTVFADNLADAWRARLQGASVEIGPHVPITNRASLELMTALGFSRVWLSPELTLGQLADLAEHSPIPLGLFVSGMQELMITEHCVLMSQGNCNQECATCKRRTKHHYLLDRKGFEFPVITDAAGRSHIYNGIALDTLASLVDLIDMGLSGFMVDTTLLDKEETMKAVKRAERARNSALTDHRSIEKKQGTTTGHLFRGVL